MRFSAVEEREVPMRGFSCGALFALLSWSCGLYAASGADYLLSQLAGGGDGRPAGLATTYQATAEAVGTLRSLGYAANLDQPQAFLAAEAYHGTEYLSRKVVAAVDSGQSATALLSELLSRQNADGGFGELAGYQSTVFDTALALEAATVAGRIGDGVTGSALTYLLQRQNPDGGWNRLTGSGEIDVTAHVLRALAPLRALNGSIAGAVQAGHAFLLSQR
jgi:hypothetical protein